MDVISVRVQLRTLMSMTIHISKDGLTSKVWRINEHLPYILSIKCLKHVVRFGKISPLPPTN